MTLAPSEQDDFRRHGVIIRRQVVSPQLLEAAQQLVEDWYRQSFDATCIAEYTQRTFAPALGEHPALLRLLTESPAWTLAESLLGQIAPVTTAQIQIRIPEADLAIGQPIKTMHVDGVS